MLNVPCGASGHIRVVRQIESTGEVTGDFQFTNIWTDVGLSHLNSNTVKMVDWPSRFRWGSGVAAAPHSLVTHLANYVGQSSGSPTRKNQQVGESYVVQRIYTGTQPARGVAWNLTEFGLDHLYGDGRIYTYALARNDLGAVEAIPVSAIEIITIYYTVQVVFPMTLPAQPVAVSGVLAETTATFTLRPDTAGAGFGGSLGMCSGTSPEVRQFAGYTSKDFANPVHGLRGGDGKSYWPPSMMNRTTGFFGSPNNNYSHIHHIWAFTPPITKTNTQELRIGINWTFSNATPIEI